MKVALYNQMFGLNGASLLGNLCGHFFLHYWHDPSQVEKRADISRTLDLVHNSGADIVGICEVFQGQEPQLEKELRKLGYHSVFFSMGHRFTYNTRSVIECLAVRDRGIQEVHELWPLEKKLGGGGGFVVARFDSYDVVLVHFALPTRRFFEAQVKHIQAIIRSLGSRVLLMGDFNCTNAAAKRYFPEFALASQGEKTCSFTPILRNLYHKDIDHILVKGFSHSGAQTTVSRSDHAMVTIELRKV